MLGQLFEPWAADLITRASLKPGCRVLDVASGLGPVARLAAEAAGPGRPDDRSVSALPADARQQLRARLASKLGSRAHSVTVHTVSNIARGTKQSFVILEP